MNHNIINAFEHMIALEDRVKCDLCIESEIR